MSTIDKISRLLDERGKTQKELTDYLGISKNAFTDWKSGRIKSYTKHLPKIAEFLNVSVDYLVGRETEDDVLTKIGAIPISNNTYSVPVVGRVAAGVPIEAIENIVGYIELDPKEFPRHHEYFGLKITGDSMEPRIWEGDIIVVQKQPDVESGQVAVVLEGDNEATCKKIIKHIDGISLIPFNTKYEDRFFSKKEIENIPIRIIGKVVQSRSNF